MDGSSNLVTHERYIRQCLELAKLSKNKVGRNPNVGSLLVYKDRVIGSGRYECYGGPHAEQNAIDDALKDHSDLISESTLYVSLEPCNYTGKRPPCSELILRYGIENLVVCCTDPNPKIDGTSCDMLRSKGVNVIQGILESEGRSVIRFFETTQIKKRPYIYLKWAQDANANMGHTDHQVWISGELCQIYTHQLRAKVDAIIVGVNTVNIDDPSLTVRAVQGDNPTRVVIDPNGRIKADCKLLNEAQAQTIVFCKPSVTLPEGKCKKMLLNDIEPITSQIVQGLYGLGMSRILIEGGAQTLRAFVKAKLWDEAVVIQNSQRKLLNIKAPTVIGNLSSEINLEHDRILNIRSNWHE